MGWYCALVHDLLKDNKANVDKSPESVLQILEERLCALYKAILLFQMKSICYYYRDQIANFFRQLGRIDDWNDARQGVVNAENAFVRDWNQYKKAQASELWDKLLEAAKNTNTQLRDISQTLREFVTQHSNFIALQEKIHLDEKDNRCLQDLRVIDAQDDMTRIEKSKGGMCDDVSDWIFNHENYTAFTSWEASSSPSRRLLWIKGPAGTGKTMLMISIIRHLFHQPAPLVPSMSYFFCQSKKANRNNATDIMRSLMWLLLYQQPDLIKHLRAEYDRSGDGLFTDDTALEAVSRLFKTILKDARPVYLLVDALDECEEGLGDLIGLIFTSLANSDKVRWLVSSRPEVALTENFPEIVAELDVLSRKDRVEKYIQYRISDLKAPRLKYTDEVLHSVTEIISERAESNLLWVFLVFNDLKEMHGSFAIQNIKDYPPGLSELYDYKMRRIEENDLESRQHCFDLLMVSSLAYCLPLSLSELNALIPWSDKKDPYKYLLKCDSFLTIEHDQETVDMIHKSAKDYLVKHHDKLRGGTVQGHADIARHSICMMSSPENDIFCLKRWVTNSTPMAPLEGSRLVPIKYPCVFWLDHLRDAIKSDPEISKDLCNDGFKFLGLHFLHWVESLSVLNELSAGIVSIRVLMSIIKVC
jgi:hypothetical protein